MEEELLRNCYKNSMKLAEENGVKTIAFPSIGTGAYGFPIDSAAPIAVGTVLEVSRGGTASRKSSSCVFRKAITKFTRRY